MKAFTILNLTKTTQNSVSQVYLHKQCTKISNIDHAQGDNFDFDEILFLILLDYHENDTESFRVRLGFYRMTHL